MHYSTPHIEHHHLHTTRTYTGTPSGRSCLIGIVAIVGIIIAFVAIVVGGIASSVGSAVASSNISLASSSSNTSSSTDLQNAPDVIADLNVMNSALTPHLAAWQAQQDTIVHHVSVADSGLPSNFNTKEVVYGHCATSKFYMFVLNVTQPEALTADTVGYEYTPGSKPETCAPLGWHMVSIETAAPNWYFVTMNTSAATTVPPTTAK